LERASEGEEGDQEAMTTLEKIKAYANSLESLSSEVKDEFPNSAGTYRDIVDDLQDVIDDMEEN